MHREYTVSSYFTFKLGNNSMFYYGNNFNQDIYVANDYSVPDIMWINQKDGTFKDEINERTKQLSWFSMGVDIADINNDCYPDIHIEDELFCIFNADGSFNPSEINDMIQILQKNNADLVFASRYEKNCTSEDDTLITIIGNFIFTKIGNIFFKLSITDILYTFVIGKTQKVKNLNLKSKDFVFCVELPIKANRNNLKLTTSKSNERARIGGIKKPNAFKDGFRILFGMIKLFLKIF